jgi:anaerobic selenocysteine-containing dehydrogenase
VHGLNALVGNINKPGGFLVHDPLPLAPLPDVEIDNIAQEGLKRPRLDEARSPKYPFSESLLNNFAQAILSESSSPVDTLLFFSSNPAFTLPDSSDFMTALKKIPFIVSFSPFRDETSAMADLILPDHTYPEKTDEVIWPIGLQYPFYALSRPLVGPIYEARTSGDVIIQLAKRVGGSTSSSFPWSKYEEVLKERAKGLYESGSGMLGYDGSRPVWESLKGGDGGDQDLGSFDDMWKNLTSGGFWYRASHQFKNWESVFKTPTGKFEFFSTRIELALLESGHQRSMESVLKDLGIQAEGDEVFMPHYEAAPTATDSSGFPLLLVPYEMINLASGWIPNPPFLFKTLSDLQLRGKESFAEVHPSTASAYNVKQGDRVIIESPKGRLPVRVHLFEGAMPGVIYLPFGLGHTAYDELVQGKGVNPNEIIQSGKDPLSGLPLWWHTPVRLAKI